MLSVLIQKELKNILFSPKFAATFAVCSILILLSVYVGIREYQVSVRQYETATQLVQQELREQSQWTSLNDRTYRKPDPMQIFVSGVNNDVGRWSSINQFEPVKLRHSAYSDDPIFAIFRFIDFSFIVQMILSLFAILFTYDAINGERESGTLALTFSNSLSRAQFILAKLLGTWLGLITPLLVPVGLAFLLLMIFRIPFTADQWLRLWSLLGVSLLFFTFFMTLGVLVSALTKRSNISFLVSLVLWIILILILPRAGVIAASQLLPVPTVAEIEARSDAFAKNRWQQHTQSLEKHLGERQTAMAHLSKEEREKYENDHMWNWMVEDDATRKQVQKEIDDYGTTLQEDLRNRKAAQEHFAFSLSRFSPASAYQLAVMTIAGTDIALKTRYEDLLRSFRTAFNDYTQQKQKESGTTGGIRISVDTERGFSINTPRDQGTLNLTDMPRFEQSRTSLTFPVIDAGILVLATLLAFGGAIVAFHRYDVRA